MTNLEIVNFDFRKRKWTFSTDKVLEALDILNIKIPVRLEIANLWKIHKDYKKHEVIGIHDFVDDQHLIAIHSKIGELEASRILWHELAHAQQTERFNNFEEYLQSYKKAGGNCIGGKNYEENMFEKEAHEFEDRYRYEKLTIKC